MHRRVQSKHSYKFIEGRKGGTEGGKEEGTYYVWGIFVIKRESLKRVVRKPDRFIARRQGG